MPLANFTIMRKNERVTLRTARVTQTPARAALIALGLLMSFSACSPVSDQSAGWVIRFACSGEGSRAEEVALSIAEGECQRSSVVVYSTTIERSGSSSAEAPPRLSPGTYAFDAKAFDSTGSFIAQTCRAVRFPSAETVVLVLGNDALCPGEQSPGDWAHSGGSPSAGPGGSASDGGASSSRVTPDQKTDGRIEVSPAEVVAGAPIEVAYFEVTKPGTPRIEIFLDAAKDPAQTFKIPFKKKETKVNGTQGFLLPTAGSYLVRLVYDHGVASQSKVEVLADHDGDKVPDRDDGCTDDPSKREPAMCGCGVPDTDTDTDGDHVIDCADECDEDPLKSVAGMCGCGLVDSAADQDSDGVSDCYDACPTDANKTAPMQFGCAVTDTDSDGDMTADCVDGCPSDPAKSAPGNCGCGVPEGVCLLCAAAYEGASVSLSCASGSAIQTIRFASFGTPSGSCAGGFSIGACNAPSSLTTVQAACVGKQSCTIAASNTVFTDPCAGTRKSLAVTYTCGG